MSIDITGSTLWEAGRVISSQLPDYYHVRGESQTLVDLLLQRATGLGRTAYLLERKGIQLSSEQALWVEGCLVRLQADEPIQYIFGEASFGPLSLSVGPGVLIPRPETEELCDRIVQRHPLTSPMTLLDVGTGSGCIPLYLSYYSRSWSLWGSDISPVALSYAEMNVARLRELLPERSNYPRFVEGDLFAWSEGEALPQDLSSIDILVSNPPYIPSSEQRDILPNVLSYEPHSALFVPDGDPLRYYRALLDLVPRLRKLHQPLHFYCEAHHAFVESIAAAARVRTGCQQAEVWSDLSGRPRFVYALFDDAH